MLYDYLIKTAYAPPKQDSPSIGQSLGNGVKLVAAHRALDIGATHAVRGSGIFKNYYSNMAREGMNAAVTGKDLMPKYRRALGVLSPSLSGLTDYEMAKSMMQDLQQKIHKQTGVRLTSLEAIRSHPITSQLMDSFHTSKLHSPITRHIVGAVDPKLKQNALVEFLRRRGGMGPDSQRYTSRIAGTIAGAAGMAIHGPIGAAALMGSIAPEAVSASVVNRDSGNALIKAKKGLIGKGMVNAMDRVDNLPVTRAKAFGLNFLSPASNEIYNFGRDLGTATNKAPEMAVRNLAKKTPIVNKDKETIRAMAGRARAATKGYVMDKFITPATKNRFGKILMHI